MQLHEVELVEHFGASVVLSQGQEPHGVVSPILLAEQSVSLVSEGRHPYRVARNMRHFLPRHWEHAR